MPGSPRHTPPEGKTEAGSTHLVSTGPGGDPDAGLPVGTVVPEHSLFDMVSSTE